MNTQIRKPSRKKPAIIAAVIIGVLALSGAALAKGGRPFRGGAFPGMALLRMVDNLNLSEQQELKAIRIRRSLKTQAEENRDHMRANANTVIGELEKPAPDAAKLHALADESIKRMSKMAHSAIDQFIDFHSSLTPDQRSTLVQNARELQEHGRKFEGKRGQKR